MIIIIGLLALQGGLLNAQVAIGYDVSKLAVTKWNGAEGISYRQVPGANLGATSFELLPANRAAYLCNSTSEIAIVSLADGKLVSKFPVLFAPRDFCYDKGFFYVLSEFAISMYTKKGKEINKFSFDRSFVGVERIARYNNSTYLLLPSGKSLLIESNGHLVSPVTLNGWITSSGYIIMTKITGDNIYEVQVSTNEGETYTATLQSDRKVAGVYVVGGSGNRLVIDVQTFISESPISVERRILTLKIDTNGIGSVIASIRVPDCYYVLSNKEFNFSREGRLYNMISTPDGLIMFELKEPSGGKTPSKCYPVEITQHPYHFNDHLITF